MQTTFHTYRVYVLRWLLPALAVLTLATVVVWPLIRDMRLREISIDSDTRVRVEQVALTLPKAGAPARIEVSRPEFIGRDEQNRPYKITADSVAQQGLQTDVPMELTRPVARLTLDSEKNITVSLEGASGIYDPKQKTLRMNGDVEIIHSTGYVMQMQDLFIDLLKGWSETTTPVVGTGPAGSLHGEAMELRDKGNHIILHGKSRITFDGLPGSDTGAGTDASSPGTSTSTGTATKTGI